MAVAANEYSEITGTDIDSREIDAGHFIFLDLPVTLSQQLMVKIRARIR
jgi:hypothetical protein